MFEGPSNHVVVDTNLDIPTFPNIHTIMPFHFEQVRLPSIMTARELPLGLFGT